MSEIPAYCRRRKKIKNMTYESLETKSNRPKTLDNFFSDPKMKEVSGQASQKMSADLIKHLLSDKVLYNEEYKIENDQKIDKLWLENHKEFLAESLKVALEEAALKKYQDQLSLAKNEVAQAKSLADFDGLELTPEIKNFIDGITGDLSYKYANGSSSFGQVKPSEVIKAVKVWLKRILKNKKDEQFGFLNEYDKEYLTQAAPELQTLIESQKENPKTLVYLTTGARLLSHFVRGLTSAKKNDKPEVRFLQCSRIPEDREKELIFERAKEIVKNSKPPFLIIDDYVTNAHKTHDLIIEAFSRAGVKDEDLIFFAFLAESKELWPEKAISPQFYRKLGINFGAFDKSGSSGGFQFNTSEQKKGTRKLPDRKYEWVTPDGKEWADKYEGVTKAAVRKNIRKSLFYFGKKLAEK
jgi:hypothetical protein